MLKTLSRLEEELPADKFIRIHKSYIVSRQKVDKVDGDILYIDSQQIPISRARKKEIIKIIFGKP